MGLLDKYIAKVAGPAPDVASILAPLLGPDDTLTAWAMASPEASEGSASSGGINGAAVLARVVGMVMSAKAENEFIGGDAGSIGRTLPRDAESLVLAISASGLSAWRWNAYDQSAPTEVYRVDGTKIRSITDSGKTRQGGARVVVANFVDDSFFGYRLMSNHDEFIAAAARRWPSTT